MPFLLTLPGLGDLPYCAGPGMPSTPGEMGLPGNCNPSYGVIDPGCVVKILANQNGCFSLPHDMSWVHFVANPPAPDPTHSASDGTSRGFVPPGSMAAAAQEISGTAGGNAAYVTAHFPLASGDGTTTGIGPNPVPAPAPAPTSTGFAIPPQVTSFLEKTLFGVPVWAYLAGGGALLFMGRGK